MGEQTVGKSLNPSSSTTEQLRNVVRGERTQEEMKTLIENTVFWRLDFRVKI